LCIEAVVTVEMPYKLTPIHAAWLTIFVFCATPILDGQNVPYDPRSYSVATPRPINPAESTTNPSAQATQGQNPYLGSVPQQSTGATIELSLRDAIERGLRFNLGLIESNEASADARAARLRSLSALLPQIEAHAEQGYQSISYHEIGLKLPAAPGIPVLPPTTGGFGYQDARVSLTQNLYDSQLRNRYKAASRAQQSSILSAKDSRDVVVFAVGTAYLQVVADAARVETAKAELASARQLDEQMAHQVVSEVSPEIDSLRAQVEHQTAEQNLTNAANEFEKDKLTLARITGLAIDQDFRLTDSLTYEGISGITQQAATEEALHSRSDLASAAAEVQAAEFTLRANRDERMPTVSISADYGGGGANVGNLNPVYSLIGRVSVPLSTGGRIRAGIEQARADLARKRAEYADLQGRVVYDVKVAWLDLNASDASVKVAERNRQLAARALAQSRDRFANGVTNFLEVVQAEEADAIAKENYIRSLYSFDVAKISLARATGGAEAKVFEFLGGK
jgi:outer membrane protein TolC